MNTDDFLLKKRDAIIKLAEKHGARNIRIFGSFARGDAGPESDVDFLVDVAPIHSPFFPGGFMVDLQELLGRKVDVVTEGGLHWYIKQEILKESHPL
jgi:predicted nucleotidyltransferase